MGSGGFIRVLRFGEFSWTCSALDYSSMFDLELGKLLVSQDTVLLQPRAVYGKFYSMCVSFSHLSSFDEASREKCLHLGVGMVFGRKLKKSRYLHDGRG